jgi:hypothetical protein
MTPDRKKPGVAFWATVVVVVLVAYPLSLGPALWISSHTAPREKSVLIAYRPLAWIIGRSPRGPQRWIARVVIAPAVNDRSIVFSADKIFFVD